MFFRAQAERHGIGAGYDQVVRVANDDAIDLDCALVELAPRFLVRHGKAQFAQGIDDADPFGGGDGLRQIATNLPFFKGFSFF